MTGIYILIPCAIVAFICWCLVYGGNRKKTPMVGNAQARQMYMFNRHKGLLGSAEPDYQGNETVYCTYRGDSNE